MVSRLIFKNIYILSTKIIKSVVDGCIIVNKLQHFTSFTIKRRSDIKRETAAHDCYDVRVIRFEIVNV